MEENKALQILYDEYGEENVELLDGNMARTPVGVVTLIQKTNPRHDIAAELYAIGIRQCEIEQILKRDKTKKSSGYYSRILKHPLVAAKRLEHAQEVAEMAKARLTGVVEKAAQNLEAAVNGGHLPSSLKILQMADVINPVQKSEVHKKISFGSWLNEGNAKTIPKTVIEEATVVEQVAICADDVKEDVEGERLTNNLFDGDKDG